LTKHVTTIIFASILADLDSIIRISCILPLNSPLTGGIQFLSPPVTEGNRGGNNLKFKPNGIRKKPP
jgi:hypothetical protein